MAVTRDELRKKISAGCDELGLRADDQQIDRFATLLTELERWSARVNLTAIRSIDKMISGHLLDSLAIRQFLHGDSIIDIGTGAGFPGLPLAIAEPSLTFVLLDSNGKKISFVQHIVGKLGLQNVRAVRARAEDYAAEDTFDTVIARALATIPRIIELGGHLTGKKGVLLALKGRYPAEELEQVEQLADPWNWKVEKISIPGLEQYSRHLVRLDRKD